MKDKKVRSFMAMNVSLPSLKNSVLKAVEEYHATEEV